MVIKRLISLEAIRYIMDFFEKRYYKLNKRFLSYIGGWPYQTMSRKKQFAVSIVLVYATFWVPEIMKIKEVWGDMDSMIECITPMFVMALTLIKYFNNLICTEQMKIILTHIKNDWENLLNSTEVQILQKYAEKGRQFTIWYSSIQYLLAHGFILLPTFTPLFLDYVAPLNVSRERKLVYSVQYHIDHNKYFYYITFHNYCTTMLTMTLASQLDSICMVYIQHVCGMFKIIGYRLKCENVHNNKDLENQDVLYNNMYKNHHTIQEYAYQNLLQSIKQHKKAIEYVNCLESAFSISYFLQILISLISISVSAVEILSKMGEMDDLLRFGFFLSGQIIHMFFLNLPGQLIINSSNQVFINAYDSQWYMCSIKLQKLLKLLLLRSITPCQLTAGKICILSMETFLAVIQTSFSYFTVLSSVRQ